MTMTRKRKAGPALTNDVPTKKPAVSSKKEQKGKQTKPAHNKDFRVTKLKVETTVPMKRKAVPALNDDVPTKQPAVPTKQPAVLSKKVRKGKQTKSAINKGIKKEGKASTPQKVKTTSSSDTLILKNLDRTKKEGKAATLQKAKTTASSSDTLILKDLVKDDRWQEVLADEFEQPYFKTLEETLQKEYKAGKEIFPPKELIFNALHLTPLDKVKVVIIGQDPYHEDGQAMGMSFSVPKGIAVPSSLRDLYKELERDPKIQGFKIPDHGCLEKWAEEGILLINSTLTVEAHKTNSHAKFGWQTFTDSIIKVVSEHCDHVVFILWGGVAQKKKNIIDVKKHIALKKFKNCSCFSDCDDALAKFGLKPINWSLE